MMNQSHVTTLKDLELEIDTLKKKIDTSNDRYQNHSPTIPLYRGHADESWKLETTLERTSTKKYSVLRYNGVLCATACAVESFTGKTWELDDQPQLSNEYFNKLPNYEFMAHIRHHGFPTPLLDWSQSLYVALFFAFNGAREDRDVAIYVYLEEMYGGMGQVVGNPEIILLSSAITTHKRHYLQQGQYTIAVELNDGTWRYCNHQEALNEGGGKYRDIVYKFTLPGSLKNTILQKLHEMNITAYSLFGDENSLMSTLAFQQLKM